MMIFIGDLHRLTDFGFHSGNGLVFGRVSEGFRGRIVVAFREHDASAHIVAPAADKLLFNIVVAVHSRAFESDVFHFAVWARHLHLASHVRHKKAPVHYWFGHGSAG